MRTTTIGRTWESEFRVKMLMLPMDIRQEVLTNTIVMTVKTIKVLPC